MRTVKCVKFSGEELPGLEYPPYPGELGDRIWANVSEKAWGLWMEHMKMIINEYRLNLADPETQKLLFEQCEKFFFGEGSALPPGYVPEQAAGGHGHGHGH